MTRCFSGPGSISLPFLLLILALCQPLSLRAADASGLVGEWHASGRDGSARLEFKADGVVLLRAGGKVTRGIYQADSRQRPMEVMLDLPPGGRQRWAVEFTGPNEFRQERIAPQAKLPGHLGKEAVSFVRAGWEFADSAITMPTDGTKVTSLTNPKVSETVLRTIVDSERRKPGGKNLGEPNVLARDRASPMEVAQKDAAGKAVGEWWEVWRVRFGQDPERRYMIFFHARGTRGTTMDIRPIR